MWAGPVRDGVVGQANPQELDLVDHSVKEFVMHIVRWIEHLAKMALDNLSHFVSIC